jgi:hypothetical protein
MDSLRHDRYALGPGRDSVERRLVAILAADVVGYLRSGQRLRLQQNPPSFRAGQACCADKPSPARWTEAEVT